MQINKDSLVIMDYQLKRENGEVVESCDEPLTFLCGHEAIITGVEEEIIGMKEGEERDFVVPPEKAYGERDATQVFIVPRNAFPEDIGEIKPGETFSAHRRDREVSINFKVLEATPELVLVDANHPLAGVALYVHVKILKVTVPTAYELQTHLLTQHSKTVGSA